MAHYQPLPSTEDHTLADGQASAHAGLIGYSIAHEKPTILSSLKSILIASPLNILLFFVPLGIFAGLIGWDEQYIFVLNFFAIIPLAKLLGVATEEISLRTNQTIGGLLNATFGNMVEAIVAVLALKSGLVRVVQASLLGSILSNLLLVLGFCFFLGGLKFKTQNFNVTAAQTAASLFCLTILALLLPAALKWQLGNSGLGNDEIEAIVLDLSRVTAGVLLLVYILYLIFQLKTHAYLFEGEEVEEEAPKITFPVSIGLLLISTLLVSVNAEYLVGSIEGISEAWNLSETFVGLILLPIVGNAAEHVSAVSVAMKNKMDLVIGIAVGSSMQIALFVTPLCVIAGWIFSTPMSLAFGPLETVVLFVSVFVTNSLISDGESNWLEGALLMGSYAVIATSFCTMTAKISGETNTVVESTLIMQSDNLDILEKKATPPTVISSLKTIVFASYLNLLIVFVPLGFCSEYLKWGDTPTFILNFLAIVPLAKLLGFATEEIALKTNQTIGGLLNATFGNLVEVLVSILSLRQGLYRVVQASLLGSILSNLLLVLGFCFFLGGLKKKTQKFNVTAAQTAASLFCLTILALFLPAAVAWQLSGTSDKGEQIILNLSRASAVN
ncbi:hypothetical protein HK096_004839 [Nowakowskiella sp. JEL0078]|nr:hypothetical protein HK096_004839 [Nowakowskiella sp. JEL0078]